jgi:serine/threonine-protein kinase PknK
MNVDEKWQLPGYDIGAVLGRGGFATVFEARQQSLGRPVAIKVLTTDISSEADRRRFDREREALSRLSAHPHVVDVYDAGVSGGRPYIVMRLYPRGSLARQVADGGPLPVSDAVAIVQKLAGALDAAHESGIVHRDIKPDNVLLTDSGEPALADFGIAALVDPSGNNTLTHASTNFFTLAHVAPEVLERQQYSAASDIYALTSTAYVLLAGRPAFDPRNNPRVVSMILDAPLPPIGRAGVSPAVEAALGQGMAKDPAQRFPSAGAFASALAAAAASGTSAAALGDSDRTTVAATPVATPLDSAAPQAQGAPAAGATPAATFPPRPVPPWMSPANVSPEVTPLPQAAQASTPPPPPAMPGWAAYTPAPPVMPGQAAYPSPFSPPSPPGGRGKRQRGLPWIVAGGAALLVIGVGAVVVLNPSISDAGHSTPPVSYASTPADSTPADSTPVESTPVPALDVALGSPVVSSNQGVDVVASLQIDGGQGDEFQVCALFFNGNRQPINPASVQYSLDGQLAVCERTTPRYPITTWTNGFHLHLPCSQFTGQYGVYLFWVRMTVARLETTTATVLAHSERSFYYRVPCG